MAVKQVAIKGGDGSVKNNVHIRKFPVYKQK